MSTTVINLTPPPPTYNAYMILLAGGGHDLVCLSHLEAGLEHRIGQMLDVAPVRDAQGDCCVCLEPIGGDQ